MAGKGQGALPCDVEVSSRVGQDGASVGMSLFIDDCSPAGCTWGGGIKCSLAKLVW